MTMNTRQGSLAFSQSQPVWGKHYRKSLWMRQSIYDTEDYPGETSLRVTERTIPCSAVHL
jgi:hypothetical protein